jgi:hypothetical protein
MDENLQELENELKRLTPRRPSAALRRALEGELGVAASATTPARRESAGTSLRPWKWASWSLAAAAVIALVAVLQISRPVVAPVPQPAFDVSEVSGPSAVSMPAAANRYEPVQATSVLYDLKEDGAATLADQSEGRQVRYRYVDTYTWKNPTTNASLRWSVPRDEVRVIRASLD